jgi:RNA polymerase sigma-B factor
MGELIGGEDPGYELAVDLHILRSLLEKLSERDRRVLAMRFFRSQPQAAIGAEIGIPQMQVSRVLSRVLAELRAGFG